MADFIDPATEIGIKIIVIFFASGFLSLIGTSLTEASIKEGEVETLIAIAMALIFVICFRTLT